MPYVGNHCQFIPAFWIWSDGNITEVDIDEVS